MSEENSSPESDSAISEESDSGEMSQSSEQSGGVEAAADALEAAVESGEITEQQAKSMLRKFQLKVNGKVLEREIDLSDEDAVRNELQLAHAARGAMQKSSEIEKLYQAELLRLKKDPYSVLAELGIDVDELSASHIEKKIEQMKKSPETLERERIQAELKEAREEARLLKEEKERIESENINKQTLSQIQEEISGAIKAHGKLPNSEYIRRKVAQEMHWAANNGYPDVKAEDVIDSVEHGLRSKISGLFEELPEEMIEQYMGRKAVDKLRAKRVAQAKAAPSLSQVKSTSASTKKVEEDKPKPKVNARDFFGR